MLIKLLYFAQISEKVGKSSEEIEFSGYNTEDLMKQLYVTYPKLEGLTFKIAVDQVLINENTDLKNGDEVALLPPFAGG